MRALFLVSCPFGPTSFQPIFSIQLSHIFCSLRLAKNNCFTKKCWKVSPAPSAKFSVYTNFATLIKGIKLNNTDNLDLSGAIKWLQKKEEEDSYGSHKSLREAILYGNEDHIPMTVWESLLDEPTEETLHLFWKISLKNYYGAELTTTKSIIVSNKRGLPHTLPQDVINNYIKLDKKTEQLITPKVMLPGRFCSNPCYFSRL